MTHSALESRWDREAPQDVATVDLFRELPVHDLQPAEACRRRNPIVQRYLPLAENIARKFSGRGESHDDLVQVARIGLVKAVIRFDVEIGTEFLAFAVPTIVGEVRRHFRDRGWSVGVPRRLKELRLRIGAATSELYQRLGRAPTASELAAELGVDREEVCEAMVAASGYRPRSLFGGDSDTDSDTVAALDRFGHTDAGLEHIEDRELLRPLLAALPERERTVLFLRFFASMTQSEIAERIGISQMHVSRLLARSLASLRDAMAAGPRPPD